MNTTNKLTLSDELRATCAWRGPNGEKCGSCTPCRAAAALEAKDEALRESTALLRLALDWLDQEVEGPWELGGGPEGEPGFDEGASRRLLERSRAALRAGEA